MKSWPLVGLDEIFEIARGGSPRPIDAYITDDPDGINWISISDATESQKYITKTKKRIRKEGASRSRAVKPGDFLLSNSMSFGKPYIMGTHGCIHDGWLVLTPRRKDVDSDFFYHLLGSQTVYREFERRAAGATVKNLNIDLVKTVKILLPPVEEQRRIAAILDQAEALRTKRRQALAKLDTLTESLFLEMFGDPVRNSMGWNIQKLGTQLKNIRYGTGSPPEYAESGIPFVRATNVKRGTVVRKGLKFITEAAAASISKCRLHQNDLIIVRSGVNAGDCALIPQEYEGAFAGYDLILNLDAPAAHFYNYLLNSTYGKKLLDPLTRRAAQPHLNADQIKDLALISPPNQVLLNFMARLQSIDGARRQQEGAIAKWDNLVAALQHGAFRGEL